jgi:2-oxoglutarate dehydrogenase E1 component
MLRLKAASSMPDEFTSGRFRPVLPDRLRPEGQVTRVVLASGKVVYELEAERARRKDGSIAILRVEQLYPLPADELAAAVADYPGADLVWVQDEPRNQGAWPFMALNLPEALAERGETRQLRCMSRTASASPATGSTRKHQVEQEALLGEVFDQG